MFLPFQKVPKEYIRASSVEFLKQTRPECVIMNCLSLNSSEGGVPLRIDSGTGQVTGTGDFVNVLISNSLNGHASEKRFARGITVADLKGKLELITGASAATMEIFVHDEKRNGALVCALTSESALLGSYPVDSGMRLHVKDTSGKPSAFDDLSKVEKFELSQDQYAKRSDTVKAYLQRNKLGKYNEEEMERLRIEKEKEDKEEADKLATMKIGDRCETRQPGSSSSRRGKVAYLGRTAFKEGLWVGIHFDEPLGKNDGSVAGKRYFECPEKYGGFVKPAHVEVGDYPEEEIDLDDLDEM